MAETIAGPRAGRRGQNYCTTAATVAMLLLLGGLSMGATEASIGSGPRNAKRTRAPAQCRTGYNSVIWRAPQCGEDNVDASFAMDPSGKHFFDSVGISDPAGCTTLEGGVCAYPGGSTACHGSCCAVRVDLFRIFK